MHLRIIQRRLALIHTNLIRTYRHQTKVFGYDAQLKTHDNVTDVENLLRKYLARHDEILFRYQYVGDYNQARQANPHVALLIDAYRKHGHRLAKIDPLGIIVNT
jgi:2-oxoglutarate dehydrogenase complex dehydrogenase (E1) component-like enzyme